MRLIDSESQLDRTETKNRILDAAERLFAQHGFELTSLRAITAEADVNLAAVHYHFGSKEGLLEAVLQRLVGPLNQERLTRLDALEARGSPTLEEIVEAFVAPALRLFGQDLHYIAVAPRLMGRYLSSPDEEMRPLMMRLFGGVIDRFTAAVGRALPHLSRDEVLWQTFFMVGVMVQTMGCGHHLKAISGGRCDPARVDETISRVVQFSVAGMRAAVPQSHE